MGSFTGICAVTKLIKTENLQKHKQKKTNDFHYFLDKEPIARQKVVRDLGFLTSENLVSKEHWRPVIQKQITPLFIQGVQ